MVKLATKFTPEVLLSTPRRSPGQPSPCGQYILHTIQSYSFEEHKRTREIRVLEAGRGLSHLVVGDSKFKQAVWLPENRILLLRDEDKGESGRTELVVTDVNGLIQVVIGKVDGSINEIKLKPLPSGDIAFVVWGKADRHGNLVNLKQQPKPAHTSMLYDSLMVRHWDVWKTRFHNSLFYGVLTKDILNGYSLKSFDSLLAGTKLECPIGPQGSSDDYDISTKGVIFVAKDPELNDATHTKSDLYFIPTPSDALITDFGQREPLRIAANSLQGAASSPVFAPDGCSAAFLKMTEDGYEADRRLVVFVPDIAGACLYTTSGDCSITCPANCTHAHNKNRTRPVKFTHAAARDDWDISPHQIVFGQDSNCLYMLVEQEAVSLVYCCDIPSGSVERISKASLGYVSEITPLSNPARLFVSGSSLVDNSFYATIDAANPEDTYIISSHSRTGATYGLHTKQVESFYYEGAKQHVHALVMKPSNFDASKKYPLAMWIHGGPQAAWVESWSTRWNPAVWAEQGYVVVMPNITGSTGYGQDFVDAIALDHGGAPYQDVVKCFDHVEANLSYVDTDRAIAAGASFGGYMMYWIQGQPLGRKFKALVCHDGVFSSFHGMLTTEELWFPVHDQGGLPWENNGEGMKKWLKWDPSRLIENWDTPMLIIHNGTDFRLPITEGLAAFNVLQTKGVPSRFLSAPDENHWTLSEENSKVWHTVVLNWANKYAGLPAYRDDEAVVIEPNEPFDA